jgi:hypothetical protein
MLTYERTNVVIHCDLPPLTFDSHFQQERKKERKKKKGKAVPLHAMEALGGRGGIAPTHSRPRH